MTVTAVDEQRGQAVKEEKEAVRGLGVCVMGHVKDACELPYEQRVAEHSPG